MNYMEYKTSFHFVGQKSENNSSVFSSYQNSIYTVNGEYETRHIISTITFFNFTQKFSLKHKKTQEKETIRHVYY